MKEHIVGLVVLIAVTVDTLTDLIVVHGNLVVEDLRLLKRGEVTLGNLHIGPCDIRWLDETIRQIFVDGFFSYRYLKRVECQPFAPFLSPDLHLDVFAFRNIEHRVPFLLGYLYLHTLAVGLLLAVGRGDTGHTCFVFVSREHEVEWRNVARDSDTAIIGEDGRQALGLLG